MTQAQEAAYVASMKQHELAQSLYTVSGEICAEVSSLREEILLVQKEATGVSSVQANDKAISLRVCVAPVKLSYVFLCVEYSHSQMRVGKNISQCTGAFFFFASQREQKKLLNALRAIIAAQTKKQGAVV